MPWPACAHSPLPTIARQLAANFTGTFCREGKMPHGAGKQGRQREARRWQKLSVSMNTASPQGGWCVVWLLPMGEYQSGFPFCLIRTHWH